MTLTMNSFKNDLHCALTDCSENDSVETQIFEEIFIFKVPKSNFMVYFEIMFHQKLVKVFTDNKNRQALLRVGTWIEGIFPDLYLVHSILHPEYTRPTPNSKNLFYWLFSYKYKKLNFLPKFRNRSFEIGCWMWWAT